MRGTGNLLVGSDFTEGYLLYAARRKECVSHLQIIQDNSTAPRLLLLLS